LRPWVWMDLSRLGKGRLRPDRGSFLVRFYMGV
jgi:hypothetical protein